jgi:hypothetical protein
MNILYKYSNILGAIRILASLELKLPFIAEVNDPSDCSPIFFFGNDIAKAEALCLKVCKSKNIPPPSNIKEWFTNDIKNKLIVRSRQEQEDWNKNEGCLLSVSANERNAVMWAHYTDAHKGVVIGFDFDAIMVDKTGIKMDPVVYSEHRPKLDILELDDLKKISEVYMIKSLDWYYEREFRTFFLVDAKQHGVMDLMNLKEKGLASFKDFNGKETWFLRFNPLSIKKVIFGLHTDEDLKLAIRKLIAGSQLQDVKLYQAVESKTYQFDIVEL